MSKEFIKKELEEISPKLASLKDHLSPVQMQEGLVDSLYSQLRSDAPISKSTQPKYANIAVFLGIAALLVFLAIYIQNSKKESENLPVELVESYVISNFDEYEEFINLENHNNEDWITHELDVIPENQIISYLENNLDQIDLENFIGNN